ncbi:MAG: TIGR03619 family F420-dependent LLM class oxidoreductase [Candidatus Rokubacteria bacterium]|nr:TIGR03619 family F420-dependent LLM class oxidoreductase [Candidatus Rokubacteria bacterium]
MAMPFPGERVRFGANLAPHADPAEQFALAGRSEALGFDALWCGDHIVFNIPLYESLTLLSFYAAHTKRIRVGTCVYLLALRHPTVAAKTTATLDALSGGRLIFGVGVGGEIPKEFEAVGVPRNERGARVTEGIEVLRALWTQTPASFSGRFFKFEGVNIDPKPVQPGGPPIWIGGRSDAALQRAARLGNGWVSYVVTADRYRQSVEKIRTAAAGRSLDGFETAHLTFITIGKDYETAKAAWVKRLSTRYNQDFGPLADRYGFIGTPAQCIEQIERFIDAGCRYFVLNAICEVPDEAEQLERLASDILPHFRKTPLTPHPTSPQRGEEKR